LGIGLLSANGISSYNKRAHRHLRMDGTMGRPTI
jgi:hypothetical protein